MFYHGSYSKLPIGKDLIKNVKGYTKNSSVKELEDFMEANRPFGCISRLSCLYASREIDLIDCSGGYTDEIYIVEMNYYEESDLSWYTLAGINLDNGNKKEAIEAANRYWSGEENKNKNESCMEIRTLSFKIKEIVD